LAALFRVLVLALLTWLLAGVLTLLASRILVLLVRLLAGVLTLLTAALVALLILLVLVCILFVCHRLVLPLPSYQ